MPPLLEARGLSKEFDAGFLKGGAGKVRAVDCVDLAVEEGETLGLIGESGCGKTTLARLLVGLLPPTAGTVRIAGSDLSSLTPGVLRRKRREFQMIFQDPAASLDPRQTVGEVLSEPFEVQDLGTAAERRRWVAELLEAVALDPADLKRPARELSGGQQQRLGIARALALRPRLVVADEPVSALDASVAAQICNLLADLQKQLGLTLVVISHSLPVIHYLSTRVAVMYLGRIVEEAPASEFFRKPLHPYSQLLVQSTSPSARAAMAREAAPGAPAAGCCFQPRCPEAMSRCLLESPRLDACGKDARVACFLYDESGG